MNSKTLSSIKDSKKKILILLLTTLFWLHTQRVFAQLKIYSVASPIIVCNTNGTDGTATVTIENAGLNSASQTLSNVMITTNLLANASVSAGIEPGTKVSSAVIQTASGSKSVSLSNVSLLNSGLFTCNIAGPITLKGGEKLVLTFYFKANCEILSSPFSAADNTRIISSNATFTSAGINTSLKEDQPVTYNLIFPVLNLKAAATSQSYIAGINDHLTRQICLTNSQGAGAIGNFTIKVLYANPGITKPSGLIVRNGSIAVAIKPVISGNTYAYAVSPTTLNSLGLGPSFDASESLMIEESLDIVNCLTDDNALTRTDYYVEWGCTNVNKPVCNAQEGTAFALIDKEKVLPDLSTKISNKTTATLCTNSSPGAIVKIVVKNNGAAKKDIAVDLTPVISWTGITITKLSVINNSTGVAYSIIPLPANGSKINLNFTSDIDGPGGLNKLNGGTHYNDLAKGESLTLEAEYIVPTCTSTCSGISRSIEVKTEYKSMCSSIIQTSNTDQLLDKESSVAGTATGGPSDMVPGGPSQTFTFSPRIQTSYQLLTSPNFNSVKLTLPPGYALASPANSKYIATGSTAITATSASQSGQVVTFKGGGIDGTYSVDLVLNVPADNSPSYCAQGFELINWSLLLHSSGTCYCEREIVCASREVYNHRSAASINCGTPIYTSTCASNKVAGTAFNAERITYGYIQTAPNKTSGTWVDSDINSTTVKANAATPNINKKAVYESDEILVTAMGYIIDPGNCSPQITRKDIHVRVTYRPDVNGAQLFALKPNSSSLIIPDLISGAVVVPVNNPSPVYDAANKLWVYDFIFNGSDPNINAAISSGNIILNTVFCVIKNNTLPANLEVKRFRGQVYAGAFNDNIESFGTSFNIYRPAVSVSELPVDTKSNYLCDTRRMLKLTVTGGCSGDDFPGEFRSIAHTNKITYQLPPYNNYVKCSSVIKTQAGTSSTNLKIADPILSGNVATGLCLTWTRNDSAFSWPLLDKQCGSYDMWLEFALTNDCNAPLGKTFKASAEYSYHDYSSLALDPKIVATTNAPDPRALPVINMYAQDEPVTDNTILLPYSITNTGNGAPNTWIAFEPNATTKIVEVYEVINGKDVKIATSVPYGSANNSLWAKLGTFSGTHYYKLKVTFNSCIERSTSAVNVFSGWDCKDYPKSPPNFPSNTAMTPTAAISCGFVAGQLKYTHGASLLRVGSMVFDSPKPICDSTKFTIMLSNQGLASMNNIKGVITIPDGVTLKGARGQFVGTNSLLNTNNFVALKLTQVSVTPNSWSVDASSLIPFNGLTNNLRFNESIKLEYSIQPSCDYPITTPISFIANAKSSCDKPITSSIVSTRIPVVDFESLNNIKLAISSENFTSATLMTPANLTPVVSLNIKNIGSFANTTDVKITAQLPMHVVYNNSVSGLSPVSIVDNPGGQLISWICPQKTLAAGGSMQIKFNVKQSGGGCRNFLMDFENLSTSITPPASEFTSDRTFMPNCDGSNPWNSYHIIQGNTCLMDTSWYKSNAYSSFQDHTTGTGQWLYAYSPSSTNNNLIWKKTVTVVPNTFYKFTYWLYLGGQPGVWWNGASQIQFNNEPVKYSMVTTNGQWVKVKLDWNAGNNTSATIKLMYMVNPDVNTQGNDYETFTGIDDIEFSQVCCFPITAETCIESQRVCSTSNTVCKLKSVTSKSTANICLIDGGKSLIEPVEDIQTYPDIKSQEIVFPNFSVFPNPFNGNTNIQYQLLKTSFVQLEVFNMMGQKVETLVNTNQAEGEYTYLLSITKEKTGSGIYYVKMTIDGIEEIKKIVEIFTN